MRPGRRRGGRERVVTSTPATLGRREREPGGRVAGVGMHNAVAIFAVNDDGQLRGISETWVHADSPRSLCIDPGGAFLYSCNQRGDSITSFHLNAATGALTFTGRFEAVGSPAVMTILKHS